MKEKVIDYLNGNRNALGSFYQALLEAVWRADSKNLAKLKSAFPEVVEGFLEWKNNPPKYGEECERCMFFDLCQTTRLVYCGGRDFVADEEEGA